MRVWIQAKRLVMRTVYTAMVVSCIGSSIVMVASLGSARDHMPCMASNVPMMTNVMPDMRC